MASKYRAFRRNDLHKVSRPILYLLAPLTFLRFFVGWGCIVLIWIYIKIFLYNHKGKDPIPENKKDGFRRFLYLMSRIILAMMSGIHVNQPKIYACYKEYLGPDWKPKWKGPGTVVSNH
mgnify:CR=1 FL=1